MKQRIKNKFGTIKAFCQSSGINWFTVINAVAGRITNPETIANINFAIENTLPMPRFDVITDNDRQELQQALNERFCGSFTVFCRKYPNWDMNFVHAVINGRRKKKDEKFERMKFELINDTPFVYEFENIFDDAKPMKKRGRPKKNIVAAVIVAFIFFINI